MRVVQLGADDYERVMSLWQRAGLPCRPLGRDSHDAFVAQLASGIQAVFGVEDGERLVGVVAITHDSRKGWINRLAVDVDYRRQGIGICLIEAAEKYLRGLGIDVIAALIEQGNDASLAAFGRAGYHHHPEIAYFSKRPSAEA